MEAYEKDAEARVAPDDRRSVEPVPPEKPPVPPPVAQVRDDDLEPHAGLRYIAVLFKILALLLVFMLIAEISIGLRQEGAGAIGVLILEAARMIVFAGFLWGAGDIALMLIESNHDLRATRILLGRIGARVERYTQR